MKLNPQLNPGSYRFVKMVSPPSKLIEAAILVFKEEEGTTLIISSDTKIPVKVDVFEQDFVWITLKTFTDLDGFGITATFSQKLANAGIPVNVVAAFNHDHLFIPFSQKNEAMEILRSIEI